MVTRQLLLNAQTVEVSRKANLGIESVIWQKPTPRTERLALSWRLECRKGIFKP